MKSNYKVLQTTRSKKKKKIIITRNTKKYFFGKKFYHLKSLKVINYSFNIDKTPLYNDFLYIMVCYYRKLKKPKLYNI